MKTHAILVVFGVLFIFSCKKDDNDSMNSNKIINEIVTPDGGTFSAEGFSLEIPAGTFIADYELNISSQQTTPFGSDALTPVYFLNDLPPGTEQAMVITLDKIYTTESVTTFLAEVTLAKSRNQLVTSYTRIENEVVGDKVRVIIPPIPNKYQKSMKGSDETVTVGVIATKGQQTITSSGGHFRITFPASKANHIANLAYFLEEAYVTFHSGPFAFDYSRRTNWPLEVSVYSMGSSLYGEQVSSVWGDNYGTLNFNADKLGETEEMRVTAGHEFLHIVQSWYDPRTGFSKAKFQSDHYWLDEAVAVWSEVYFTDVSDYTSKARTGNEYAPFEGGVQEDKEDARGYGYGMSGVVKYIASTYGIGTIRNIYEKIYQGKKPGDAIHQAIDLPYSDWYDYMLREYTRGNIYSDVNLNFLLGSKTDDIDVNTSADTLFTLTDSYRELGSKIYYITVKEAAINNNSSLSIAAEQSVNQKINLYKIKSSGSQPELIGSDAVSVAVSNLKTLVAEGYKFLLVTSNLSYSGGDDETTLSFSVKINNRQTYKAFSFSLSVMCHHTHHYNSGSTNSSFGAWHSSDMMNIPVTQVGNVLTASWNGIYGSAPSSGTATITLNNDGTASAVIHQDLNLSVADRITDCTVVSIPRVSDTWYSTYFTANDSFPYIQSLYWKETYSSFYIEMDDYYYDPVYAGKSLTLSLIK